MANDQINIDFYSFDFTDPQITKVVVKYRNLTEPSHPIWGGGTKTKDFPARIPAVELIEKEVVTLNFVNW